MSWGSSWEGREEARVLGQNGGWGWGDRGLRPSRKGPRVSEHREVLLPSSPKDLGAEVGGPAASGASPPGWGSRGQKEDKEDPLTPVPV